MKMYGGTISGNYSNKGGGGVRLAKNDDSRFYMYGGKISGNSTNGKANGGGIYVDYGHVEITGGEISENSAKNGGAIYCTRDNSDTLIINPDGETVYITNNTATEHGAGICMYKGEADIKNVNFSGNEADEYGGGVYCDDDNGTIISDCTLTGNSAEYGGALYINEDNVKLHNVTVTGNTVTEQGAVYANQNDFTITGKIIVKGNSAPTAGDADVFLNALNSDNSVMLVNENLSSGSAIYVAGDFAETSAVARCASEALASNNTQYFIVNSDGHYTKASASSIVVKPVLVDIKLQYAQSRGSIFGEGSKWIIIGVAVVLIAAAAVTTVVVVKKKKKKKPAVADGAKESEESEESENE